MNPKPQSKSIPLLKAANPPPPSLPTLEVDYDEVPEEEDDEVTKQVSGIKMEPLYVKDTSQTNWCLKRGSRYGRYIEY